MYFKMIFSIINFILLCVILVITSIVFIKSSSTNSTTSTSQNIGRGGGGGGGGGGGRGGGGDRGGGGRNGENDDRGGGGRGGGNNRGRLERDAERSLWMKRHHLRRKRKPTPLPTNSPKEDMIPVDGTVLLPSVMVQGQNFEDPKIASSDYIFTLESFENKNHNVLIIDLNKNYVDTNYLHYITLEVNVEGDLGSCYQSNPPLMAILVKNNNQDKDITAVVRTRYGGQQKFEAYLDIQSGKTGEFMMNPCTYIDSFYPYFFS